jgi:hypothetical protein
LNLVLGLGLEQLVRQQLVELLALLGPVAVAVVVAAEAAVVVAVVVVAADVAVESQQWEQSQAFAGKEIVVGQPVGAAAVDAVGLVLAVSSEVVVAGLALEATVKVVAEACL